MPSPLIEALIKVVVLIGGLMTSAAYLVLLERRFCAWMQDRRGPNRVGLPLSVFNPRWKDVRLFGLGQPLADGVKFILKEEYTPAHVDRRLFILAPIVILAAALAVFAAVPFGSVLPKDVGGAGREGPIELVAAPGLNVGLIYVFALSSVAVYGVILGGWASNNKYSFLGGLRSSAQLIAYELPLGLGILGVVLATGSLDLGEIISAQAKSGWWYFFMQPLGCLVFVVAAFAEAARLPFDLPECEQELIGGYHTEYSGIKLLLFLVAEFLHMILASFLIVILFFGGWHLWIVTGSGDDVGWFTALARVVVLGGKVLLVVMGFMLVRWSWPRFRFDQLMSLAWKVMLPLGIVNFIVVAALDQARTSFGWPDRWANWVIAAIAWGVGAAAWLLIARSGPLVSENVPNMR